MRVVVTGGAGFVGGAVVRALAGHGANVHVLDRDASRAATVREAGATFEASDLRDESALERVFRDADAVVHAAGWYKVGITASERPAMTESNVLAATRVIDAAAAAGTPHIVHVSTYGIFGDTRGRVVDEAYRRPPGDPILSWYDHTKLAAHEAAEARRAAGAPVSIVLLGAAYGPGDPSGLGDQLRRAVAGSLPAVAAGRLGVSWTHVDDLGEGIARVARGARPGGDWNLGGEIGTLRDGIEAACRAAGRRAPRLSAPAPLLYAMAKLGQTACSRLGFPANLAEAVRCTDGVTYWGSHEKAARVLGYAPRPMDEGFVQTFGR